MNVLFFHETRGCQFPFSPPPTPLDPDGVMPVQSQATTSISYRHHFASSPIPPIFLHPRRYLRGTFTIDIQALRYQTFAFHVTRLLHRNHEEDTLTQGVARRSCCNGMRLEIESQVNSDSCPHIGGDLRSIMLGNH